jgi:hypothetical protein
MHAGVKQHDFQDGPRCRVLPEYRPKVFPNPAKHYLSLAGKAAGRNSFPQSAFSFQPIGEKSFSG